VAGVGSGGQQQSFLPEPALRLGVLRLPEDPATLIGWLATPMAAEFHGQALSIDDVNVRRRLADDLGVPMFGARELTARASRSSGQVGNLSSGEERVGPGPTLRSDANFE